MDHDITFRWWLRHVLYAQYIRKRIVGRILCIFFNHHYVPYFRPLDAEMQKMENGDIKQIQRFSKLQCLKCRKVVSITVELPEGFCIAIAQTE